MTTPGRRRQRSFAERFLLARRRADAGLVVEILSSDPSVATVAPYGGTRPTFTPNPLAFGIPTGGDPIMIDIEDDDQRVQVYVL